MKINVFVPKIGKNIILDDTRDFIARGGQAALYGKNQYAFKIYHDPAKMIPVKKIQELQNIKPDNVLKPIDIIYDKRKKPLGYIMTLVKKGHPICKLFTKSFKTANTISSQDIVAIAQKSQMTVADIHSGGFLIVDLNEFNLMISSDFVTPIFLDVDSYQTPTFPANALMESVRDPLVQNNQFTAMSDWFSWAIVTFQLYVGIHPYKGSHPNYKRKEWRKRMDEGISVFNKDVSIPSACLPFSVIPKRHLDWFKEIFVNNGRSIPPLPDSMAPVGIITYVSKIIRSGNFKTDEVFSYPDAIVDIFTDFGITYIATTSALYRDSKQVAKKKRKNRTLVLIVSGKPVIIDHEADTLKLATFDQKFNVQESASEIMYKDNRLYSVYVDNLFEHIITDMSGKFIHTKRLVSRILSNQAKIFDGVIIQRSLNASIVILPFETGKCITRTVPELNDYRILNAKAEGNIMVVLGEKNGLYHRLVFVFSNDFSSYDIRLTEDVSYSDINFTVLPDGLCVLVSGDSEIELFKDNSKVKVVDNPPFDSTMKLFNINGRVHYVNGNKVFSATMITNK